MGIRLPKDSERQVVIGRTGGGKTWAMVYALANRSYDRMPWVVLNYKEDELINSIPGAVHLYETSLPPDAGPGVYVVHSAPDDYEGAEQIMSQIWHRRSAGLLIDEGYMVAKSPQAPNKWFRRLLTQGRSLNCPLIVGTQKPSHIDSFVFSESEFFQVFQLRINADIDKVECQTGQELPMDQLPRFYSFWIDNIEGTLSVLRPCPDKSEILGIFESRMPKELVTNSCRPKSVRFL